MGELPGVPGGPFLPGAEPSPLPGGGPPGIDGIREAGDHPFLVRALLLGRRGWGRVHPNPMVGCVLVRDGVVVGEGWHAEYGGPHAEAVALEAAGAAARGAVAYVSLEPCAHHGKTPPCADALHAAGVARVVYAAADPGPGRGGAERLRALGIPTEGPLLEPARARAENPGFHAGVEGRGWVVLKLAVSMDGRIAEAPGERTPISGPLAGGWVHRLRAGFDAILIGAATARTDDPLLTPRGDVLPRVPPARVVLDPRATLSPEAALFRGASGGAVLVLVGPDADSSRREALAEAGAAVVQVPAGEGGLELSAALDALRARGLHTLLCEGGGRLARSLLEAGRVDRIHLVVAPVLLGGGGVPAFPSGTPERFSPSGRWRRAGPPVAADDDVILTWDREAS